MGPLFPHPTNKVFSFQSLFPLIETLLISPVYYQNARITLFSYLPHLRCRLQKMSTPTRRPRTAVPEQISLFAHPINNLDTMK